MQFDTVKSSFDRELGGVGKRLLIPLNVVNSQRCRNSLLFSPSAALGSTVILDISCRNYLDSRLPTVGTSKRPKLGEDRTALCVDTISRLFPLLDVLLGV